MNEEYFTNNMKPYAENINDGLLLADGVDLTVYTKLPQMFNDGRFPNEINNTRQCGVSLVTLIEKEETVEINNTNVTGSGRIVFKIYPNFNQFHKWNRISWVCETGTLTCSLEKIDGTEILSDIENGASLTEHSELKKLQEINLVLNLENAVLTEISLEFVNNTPSSNRVIVSINQANVTGLEDELDSLQTEVLPTLLPPHGGNYLKSNELYYSKKGNVCMVDGTYELNSRGGVNGYIVGFLPNSFKPIRPVQNVLYWGDGYTVRCSVRIIDGQPALYFETEWNRIIPQETVLYVHIVWLCESESV